MQSYRILVADDEAGQRELLSGFLRHEGYDVAEASDGVEAVALLRQGGIDLVLLDQKMPRLGGTEAIRALLEVDPEIDVVVVTAFSSVEALKAGAVDYLAKPVDLDRLQIVARKALERRTLLRENRELRQKLAGGPRLEGIVSGSGVMEELINTVARAAPTEATVLIAGESADGLSWLVVSDLWCGRRLWTLVVTFSVRLCKR